MPGTVCRILWKIRQVEQIVAEIMMDFLIDPDNGFLCLFVICY